MALATLDTLKELLGIPPTNTAKDARLQLCLDAASAEIMSYLGREIVSRNYPSAGDGRGDSGYYTGNGRRELVLRQRPVTAITSAYVDNTGRFGENPDGAFAAATLLVEGRDYVLQVDGCLPNSSTPCSYSGILLRIGSVWPLGTSYDGRVTLAPAPIHGNIKIAYTAGFATVPRDVRNACLMLAAANHRNADKGGAVSSESLGGYSYSLNGSANGSASSFPEFGSIRAMLRPFKEVLV